MISHVISHNCDIVCDMEPFWFLRVLVFARVGQQLETNILGSSIYETKRYWVPVSTNILGSSIYETSTGYQQRYSQKSKRVGDSNHSQESKRVYWIPVSTKTKYTGFQYLRIYCVSVSTKPLLDTSSCTCKNQNGLENSFSCKNPSQNMANENVLLI